MSIIGVRTDQPGKEVLLSGNEAIARGAIEAGVQVATAYPGSPSSEVLGTLGQIAGQFGLYAEWSVNEKVAAEMAAAASFTGLRSITVMKPDGMNVALDFLTSLSCSGCNGGMVIVLGDDPGAHSSSKEMDSRFMVRVAHLPLLEPTDVGEAKEMTRLAFELSEYLQQPVVVRSVTRVCHASGNVVLGPVEKPQRRPLMDKSVRYLTSALGHVNQEHKLKEAAIWVEEKGINKYLGPENAATVVIASGPSYLYTLEAVESLGIESQVGVLNLGMTWPLEEPFLIRHLQHADRVIFAEEIEPFIEDNVKALAAQNAELLGITSFHGKMTGDLGGGIGEMNPDMMISLFRELPGLSCLVLDQENDVRESSALHLPRRELAFCAGCPHRAAYWAIKCALELDGRDGFVVGDIGCYYMGIGRTGYHLLRTVHCMGAGAGLAGGFGMLSRFGFDQPAVSVVGDSTFYHAVVPSLINARHNGSNFLCVVLDNGTTAMTGHQPHPGCGVAAAGEPASPVSMEKLISGLGIPVYVQDPYDVEGTIQEVCSLLREEGPKVLILRRACALVAAKQAKKPRVFVDGKKCIGDACGCNRFCSRVFNCPANIWDSHQGTARIDEAVCNGCKVCTTLCPQRAIIAEDVDQTAQRRAEG
ncbi:MAG: thiamine pyrophosphate-dependent enzyme [Bacillota bacterium]